ncbi:BREX system serine/threonine kinase PglW [Agromyces sp. H66]|uniref:BREX system serine/threonine kinase PglW n=1 Tax=Agromyces sp. H66 TaxID=2529859 RepID=UPI0010AB28E3|nr:BREX system serine/threonine kinase PglW [Agromyces sp. H66]
MKSDSNRWIPLGEPATPAESDALERFRELLPDDGIATAWVNLTAINPDGRTDEIDALLLTRAGLFVLEFKGWHGEIYGKATTWERRVGKRLDFVANPYILTDSKAKRLASTLKDAASRIPGKPKVPFVTARIVLHGKDSKVSLDAPTEVRVLTLDGYNVKGLPAGNTVSNFLSTPIADQKPVDGPRANEIRKIIEAAGFLPTPKTRTVGHYQLDNADPLGEGAGWRDVLVTHPDTGKKRRMRLFDVPRGASAQALQQIELNAKREFAFTDGLSFPGIARAIEYFATDNGPALLFDYHPDDVPLDDFLAGVGAPLDLDARLGLIRSVGEVLSYAHARRLTHRALTPRQIYVRQSGATLTVAIRDWMTAQRASSSTTSLTIVSGGVSQVDSLVEHASWVYLAPETLRHDPDAPPIALDVYGLGAVAFLILTGEPPAQGLKDLLDRVQSFESLDPLSVSPDLPEPVAEVITKATMFQEIHRTIDIDSVLASLEYALDEITRPDDADERREAEGDPIDASKGETIAERFVVQDRRGSGSTGTALLVDDFEAEISGVILKLARDDAAAARLHVEADVLRNLDHPRVVKLIEGPITVGERTALVLSDAGAETLALKLQNEGRATIEQLERFGADLLEAVAYLDAHGVFHRDIKPANLAVAPDPGTRKPRLNLFDFSLAKEPVRNIQSGSRPYLDPFLGQKRRQQYDRAAELYAVAVTLFEMAVASTPWWDKGGAGPTGTDDTAVVHDGLFDAGVASGLTSFFAKAFTPDATERFANVSEIAEAWRRVFAEVDAVPGDEKDAPSSDARAESATLDTPIEQSGLSARAVSALARVDATTVGELLAVPPVKLNAVRGMGERVRKEVQGRIAAWRARLLSTTTPPATPDPTRRESIERRTAALVPRATEDNAAEVNVLTHLLGFEARDVQPSAPNWPSMAELSKLTDVSIQDVLRVIDTAVVRWKKNGTLRGVLDDLVETLLSRGRVATADELASALMVAYGSALDGAARRRRALGLLRAAIETDAAAATPRFQFRRTQGAEPDILIALTSAVPSPGQASVPTADAMLDVANALAGRVDALVESGEVVDAASAREQLRAAAPDTALIDDQRLVELAVSASSGAARSSVGEVYPKRMPGDRAVETALRGIAVRDLTRDGIIRRTESRFPLAEQVPHRPALDDVIARTHPHLVWSGDAYRPRSTVGGSYSSTTLSRTDLAKSLPASDLHARLLGSIGSNAALTLAVNPRRYTEARRYLTNRYDVTTIDLAAELVRRMHAVADERGAKWAVVTRADASEASSNDFKRVSQIARQAFEPYWRELSAEPNPLLLTNAAPIARYGLTEYLAEMFDLARPRPAARWLLVPHKAAKPTPDLDGRPIPLGPDRWVSLPSDLAELFPSSSGVVA